MQIIISYLVHKKISEYFKYNKLDIIYIDKQDVYNEISSHSDIFLIKINNNLVISDNIFSEIMGKIDSKYNLIKVDKIIDEYPNTVRLNVCLNNNIAIHNFKYTDNTLNKLLDTYTKINVNQGYTNCNILYFGNSYITSDIGVYNELIKNNLDVLYLDKNDLDIKLISNNKYSNKQGFIGGCSVVYKDTVIFFGSLDKFKCKNKLINYITSRGYKVKDFKNIDVIDIGSAVIL